MLQLCDWSDDYEPYSEIDYFADMVRVGEVIKSIPDYLSYQETIMVTVLVDSIHNGQPVALVVCETYEQLRRLFQCVSDSFQSLGMTVYGSWDHKCMNVDESVIRFVVNSPANIHGTNYPIFTTIEDL